jgi:hypothetical protein
VDAGPSVYKVAASILIIISRVCIKHVIIMGIFRLVVIFR